MRTNFYFHWGAYKRVYFHDQNWYFKILTWLRLKHFLAFLLPFVWVITLNIIKMILSPHHILNNPVSNWLVYMEFWNFCIEDCGGLRVKNRHLSLYCCEQVFKHTGHSKQTSISSRAWNHEKAHSRGAIWACNAQSTMKSMASVQCFVWEIWCCIRILCSFLWKQ